MFVSMNRKSPFYQLTYEVDGKRTTISTKTTDLKEANTFMMSFDKKISSSKILPVESNCTTKNITLTKFRSEYLEYLESSKSKHYVRSAKLSFNMLIKYTGDIQLKQLSLGSLDKFINSTFARSPRAAALYYRTIKAAFSKAIIWEYISENPLKKIKSPKVAKNLPLFISEIEFDLIMGNTKQQYLKDLFLTAFYTGMRLGEIINMKWEWVDWKQNIITVMNSETFTTKSKKERIIPICSVLNNCLSNRIPKILSVNKKDFVFTNTPGIRLNENFVSKQFKKSVRAAGLDDKIHFHTLRHSFASNLAQRGVSLYVIKELLGHEDLSTTQIYSHLQSQNLRDAVNLL